MNRVGILISGLIAALVMGCASDGGPDGPDCTGDSCDVVEPSDFACQIEDRSFLGGKLEDLNDPIANFVLKGVARSETNGCPTNFTELVQKLQRNDTEGCENPEDGMTTRVMHVKSQFTGHSPPMPADGARYEDEADRYHTVTSRACNGRKKEHLMILQSDATEERAPHNLEVVAFQPDADDPATEDVDESLNGVWNYYALENDDPFTLETPDDELEPGKWTYFGSSIDMMQPGARDVSIVSLDGVLHAENRCAQCHRGGGLLMRELDTPWLNWEGHEDVPGAEGLVEAHKSVFGSKSSGAELEGVVKSANRSWNEKRIDIWADAEAGNMRELLRPLFCSLDVNIDNGTDFKDSEMTKIKSEFFVDPFWKVRTSVEVPGYEQAVASSEQIVPAFRNAEFEGKPVRDTVFKFAYPERGFADMDFQKKLIDRKIVDPELVADILAIDFTRPIFSSTRCDLVELLPDTPPTADQLNPEAIAKILDDNARGGLLAPAAEKQLKANLAKDGPDLATHTKAVEDFMTACTERLTASDALRVAARMRADARAITEMGMQYRIPSGLPVHASGIVMALLESGKPLPIVFLPELFDWKLHLDPEDCSVNDPLL